MHDVGTRALSSRFRLTTASWPISELNKSPLAPRAYATVRDSWNRVRYGSDSPRFAERLWTDPRQVTHFARKGVIWRSAQVLRGWTLDDAQPIEDDPIVKAAIARWVTGLPWEETGELERMDRVIAQLGEHSGCRTRAEVLGRCRRLDEIFRMIERERRVRPQGEVEPDAFRELGGIGMHIGPGGRPLRAGNGRHRFAIAWILRIPLIPVRVGLVHESALPLIPALRHGP